MSVIYIKNIAVTGHYGVEPSERQKPQKLLISVELEVDTRAAELSDNVDDTVSWSVVRRRIVDTVENNSFKLMEKLSSVLADTILEEDQRIQKLMITIVKPEAFTSGVPGIHLSRQRK